MQIKFPTVLTTAAFLALSLSAREAYAQAATPKQVLESGPFTPGTYPVVAGPDVDFTLQRAELAVWVTNYLAWQKWNQRWFNRVARNSWTGVS